jgi:hypothetical protein
MPCTLTHSITQIASTTPVTICVCEWGRITDTGRGGVWEMIYGHAEWVGGGGEREAEPPKRLLYSGKREIKIKIKIKESRTSQKTTELRTFFSIMPGLGFRV